MRVIENCNYADGSCVFGNIDISPVCDIWYRNLCIMQDSKFYKHRAYSFFNNEHRRMIRISLKQLLFIKEMENI